MSSVKTDWNIPKSRDESENMTSRAYLARRISLTCVILGFFTVNLHLLIRIGQEMGLVPGKSEFRLPFFEGYYPFNYRISPIYELVWLTQYIGTGLATFAYSGIYCLFVALMLHLCAQFAILKNRLEDSVSLKKNGKDFKSTLIQIVERHKELNRYIFTFLIYF